MNTIASFPTHFGDDAMSTHRTTSRNRSAALAVLLILAALVPGCGKALSTSPAGDPAVMRASGVNASSLNTPLEDSNTGGGGQGSGGVVADVRTPSVGSPGASGIGLAKGFQRGHGHAWGRHKH
jgi:hypothetical protein